MNAIGLIETIGYVAAIEASDACVKSANVNIVSLERVGAGIVTLTICGDVGAVKSAVEAGEMAASRIGTLRSSHVIPRMHSEVADALFKKEETKVVEDVKEQEEIYLNETLDIVKEETEEINENKEQNLDTKDTEITELNLTEEVKKVEVIEEINNSNIDNEDVLEQLHIDEENSSEENTTSDKEDLSKHSVKELKAMAKKLDSSITYKELNILKKEELINLVKKLNREDR